MPFEHGRGQLDDRLLLGTVQADQLGVKGRLALPGCSQCRVEGPEIPARHGPPVVREVALHLGESSAQPLHAGPGGVCLSIKLSIHDSEQQASAAD